MGGRDKRISEFEARLVYKVISRTARVIQRNPVLKKKKKKKLGPMILSTATKKASRRSLSTHDNGLMGIKDSFLNLIRRAYERFS